MRSTSRGATLIGPDKLEVREYPLPEVLPDGALVAVEMAGVCGTDVKYLHGKRQQMPLPIILGHEILGRVVKLGAEAASIHGLKKEIALFSRVPRVVALARIAAVEQRDFARSARVYGGKTTCANPPHLFGGFADYIYLAPDVLVTKVSDTLPAEAAVLIGAVMANGFQWAVRRGGLKMGDYILIQGPGQQGLACTFAARTTGAARIFVTGMAKDEKRLEMAKRFGAHRTINVEKENVLDVLREETDGAMADVVVDVSGSPQAIRTSVQCVREQGTMVLGGLTGDGYGNADVDGHLRQKRDPPAGYIYRG